MAEVKYIQHNLNIQYTIYNLIYDRPKGNNYIVVP